MYPNFIIVLEFYLYSSYAQNSVQMHLNFDILTKDEFISCSLNDKLENKYSLTLYDK